MSPTRAVLTRHTAGRHLCVGAETLTSCRPPCVGFAEKNRRLSAKWPGGGGAVVAGSQQPPPSSSVGADPSWYLPSLLPEAYHVLVNHHQCFLHCDYMGIV
ncbi:hypothetical protein IF1G_10341 [Cordyceps javanica]|uniref:Uncharacterized protein n=1 Tax=Cordyceps javanica TaxID=43265 RepID=A0A545UNR1_9HYPO|nr:hypothetical protein IF1G_10341 [Cordyceps javanica]